jgi:hypothetical protein
VTLTLLHEGLGDWEVWIALQDGDPTKQTESFILGEGVSADQAIEHAHLQLQKLSTGLTRLAHNHGASVDTEPAPPPAETNPPC